MLLRGHGDYLVSIGSMPVVNGFVFETVLCSFELENFLVALTGGLHALS